jgi:hypothetical protein
LFATGDIAGAGPRCRRGGRALFSCRRIRPDLHAELGGELRGEVEELAMADDRAAQVVDPDQRAQPGA